MSGFMVEDTRVDITIGNESLVENTTIHKKERPIWMIESTIINSDDLQVCIISFHLYRFFLSLI